MTFVICGLCNKITSMGHPLRQLIHHALFCRKSAKLQDKRYICKGALSCTIYFLHLKLTCRHINRRHICFNIKSISVHPLLWMNVMHDFICMVFAGM